jgi:hypothetical protein
MNTDTSTQTPAELRASAAAHRTEAADSFERCDTDGFATQAAHGIMARENELQAEITEAGGLWEFPALFDLDGNLVPAKLIDGQYGSCWALLDPANPEGRFLGFVNRSWASKAATRNRNMAKKGYTEGTVRAPAKAELGGGGKGMAGMMSVTAYARRLDGGFSADAEVVRTTEVGDF